MGHNIQSPKVESTGHSSSSSVLIMLVSLVVPEKLPGQKGVTKNMIKKKKNVIFWAFLTSFQNNSDMTICNILCLCVYSLDYSTLILIFDPFCFSLLLKGVAKIQP